MTPAGARKGPSDCRPTRAMFGGSDIHDRSGAAISIDLASQTLTAPEVAAVVGFIRTAKRGTILRRGARRGPQRGPPVELMTVGDFGTSYFYKERVSTLIFQHVAVAHRRVSASDLPTSSSPLRTAAATGEALRSKIAASWRPDGNAGSAPRTRSDHRRVIAAVLVAPPSRRLCVWAPAHTGGAPEGPVLLV